MILVNGHYICEKMLFSEREESFCSLHVPHLSAISEKGFFAHI